MTRRSPVKTSDMLLAYNDAQVNLDHAPWCRSWMKGETNEDSLHHTTNILFNGRFSQFVSEFLTEYSYFGILSVAREVAANLSETDWVVFKRRSVQSSCMTVTELIEVIPGAFVYLSERNLEKLIGESANDDIGAFFEMFDGLRDSIPFWGGDYFRRPVNSFPVQALKSRDVFEKRWVDSRVIYVRGNCDYFVVGSDGSIGYIPIEAEKRIKVVAKSFLDYLINWIEEDRRLYHIEVQERPMSKPDLDE